jgi:hypothetical protein
VLFAIITYNVQEMEFMRIQNVPENDFRSIKTALFLGAMLFAMFLFSTMLIVMIILGKNRTEKSSQKKAENRYRKGFEAL